MKLQHSILRVIYPVLVAIFLAFAWSKYDGSDIREPSPNTRELHTDVLYMNIPVDANVLAGMIGDKLQPHVFDGKGWISVAFSHAVFDFYIPFIGLVHFSSFGGYQHKVNVLVWDDKRKVPGYLITDIYFEDGVAGWIKAVGAIITQSLPATTVKYHSEITEGRMKLSWAQSGETIEIVAELGKREPESEFSHFVIDRPYKYLLESNKRTVYSPLHCSEADLAHFRMDSYNHSRNRAVDEVALSGNPISGTEMSRVFHVSPEQIRFIWSERILFLNRENSVF